MAVEVLWDAFVSINAVEHSDHLDNVQLSMSIEELEAATFGSETKIKEPGLIDFSLQCNFKNEFSSGGFDQLIAALVLARSKVAVVFRKSKTDAVAATNPEYQFTAFVSDFGPGAAHGQLVAGSLTLATTTALTRATS